MREELSQTSQRIFCLNSLSIQLQLLSLSHISIRLMATNLQNKMRGDLFTLQKNKTTKEQQWWTLAAEGLT